MKYKKGWYAVVAFCSSFLWVVSCQRPDIKAQLTYKSYCGNCHALPDISQITKARWQERILPEMGARLGIVHNSYDPFQRLPAEERMIVENAGTYPRQPVLSEDEWSLLVEYILAQAPDSIPLDTGRSQRNSPLQQFTASLINYDDRPGSSVTSLNWNSGLSVLTGTDAAGKVWEWSAQNGATVKHKFEKALIDHSRWKGGELITEIGTMQPNDLAVGRLWLRRGDADSVVVDNLQRAVFTQVEDLDDDGKDEVILCEFGNRLGRLSMLKEVAGSYQKVPLLTQPGAISVHIADFNGDGLKDIMALMAQGNEGIYILFQGSNLSFVSKQVVALSPDMGSSSMDVIDYDGDGDLDVVLVTGDNEESPPVLKPSHGVRIYLNNGHNDFTQAFFYPVYGASQVKAADFDNDGDTDLAVSSFFPDFQNTPEESFVYLENRSTGTFDFKPHTTPLANGGRWIVMEKGDFDSDGDTDLLLGCFTIPPPLGSPDEVRQWLDSSHDLLLLENVASGGAIQ